MSRTLPNLALTGGLASNETGWGSAMNLNLLKLTVLTQGRVINKISSLPGSPSTNDVYVLDETHGTNPNQIAIYDNGAWAYLTVLSGWEVYNTTTGQYLFFNGTVWSNLAPTSSELWTGTSVAKFLTPKSIFDMASPQTLTDAATVTPDFNAGLNFEWTIGGARTLANPSNTKAGQSGTIKIVQDATGGRVITYGNNWRFPGGSATGGLLSTAANAIDVIAYTVATDGKIYATLSKAFAV